MALFCFFGQLFGWMVLLVLGFGFVLCEVMCYVVGIVVDCRRVLGLGVVV